VKKLSNEDVEYIRSSGRSARELASEFNVSLPTIYNVLNFIYHATPDERRERGTDGPGRPRTRFPSPCECGCGTPTMGRFAPGHALRTPEYAHLRVKSVAREPSEFIAYVLGRTKQEDRGYGTPCMIWQGPLDPKTGYATTTYKGVTSTVHRHLYQAVHDVDLPRNITVDHQCNQRDCQSLNHLKAMTHADNIRRSPNTKLTKEAVHIIRASSASNRELAERFGVSEGYIPLVKNGTRWADV
jgi:transposase